jgi:AcrR family transcriptional regulator
VPRRSDSKPLNEERVLDAALQLVDEAGMDGLSMRKLGARLGVDPMAVYYYVPNKQVLLRRLVERIFGKLRPVAASGSWQTRVLDWAYAYRGLALAHPNLVLQIVTNPDAVAVAVPLANESLYAALGQSGIDEESVSGAGDALVDYINGHVLAQVEINRGEAPGDGGAQSFRFSLDLILAGIEAMARRG